MRFKDYLKEAKQEPTTEQYVEAFKSFYDLMMNKVLGNTVVTAIRPVRDAHVFWHDKSGVFVLYISIESRFAKGKQPADADPDQFADIRYWVEWDPRTQKRQLFNDLADAKDAKMGGLLKRMSDDPEIQKKIEAKAGKWYGRYIEWERYGVEPTS